MGFVCRNFDKDHIDPAVMKKIQAYTPQPEFQPEKIEKVGVTYRWRAGWHWLQGHVEIHLGMPLDGVANSVDKPRA